MYKIGIDPKDGCICILKPDGKRSFDHYWVDYVNYTSSISWRVIDPFLPAEAFYRVRLFGIPLWMRRRFHDDEWRPQNEEEAAQAMIYATWLCDALNARIKRRENMKKLSEKAVELLSDPSV